MKHDASRVIPDSLHFIPHCHVGSGLRATVNGLNRATARFGGPVIEKMACSGITNVPLAPLDEPEWHRTAPAGLHRPAARMVREDVRRTKRTVLDAFDGCGGKRVAGTSLIAMHQPPPVYASNSGIYPTLHAMGDNELRNMRSVPKTVTSSERLWLVCLFAPLPPQRTQSEPSRRYGAWRKATHAALQKTNDAKVLHRPREGEPCPLPNT